MVELRDLRWALVTAQHRSLRQAAEELRIRQSTLSRGLRSLERELVTVLFERTNGGTRPTPAGQEFLTAANRIVEEVEVITQRLRSWQRGETGHLTIGVHASISAGNLRATLIEYHRQFPGVDILLVDGSSDQLITALQISALDLAVVVGETAKWDDNSLVVWSERVVLAVPDTHHLATQEIVRWDDLRSELILLPYRGPGAEFVHLISRKSPSASPPRVVHQDVGADRLLTLVGAGFGIALGLEGATGALYPGVIFRELHDVDGPTRMEFRAHWRRRNSNPSLRPFLELLRERYPDFSGSVARD